ncbi:MAG TPA: response regulator [Bryobacteraceae bacterium]|nr:response regulator [Bryobacteraceae bacterium]
MPAAIAEFPVAESPWHVDPGFLASLNYEIRTPLSGILGMADLLVDTGLTEAQQEYVNATRFCAESLTDVLNAAAEYVTSTFSVVDSEEIDFDPAALLESVIDEQRFRASLRRLELICTIDADIPPILSGDARRLRQALNHLLAHAVRSAIQRRVLVSAVATPARSGVTLRISMCDSAWESAQERRFDARERSRTRAEQGAPLSVAVAQRLVTSIGGDLTIETGPNGSCRSTVKAPFGVPGESNSGSPPQTTEQPRILLVEDNDVFQTVVRHMLRRHELPLDCVSDGASAIEQARARHYDLILMDLQMPVMDGFATTEKIREIPGYRETPILAITANTSDEFRTRSDRHGMQEFLSKPIRSAELIAAIRRWVHQQNP